MPWRLGPGPVFVYESVAAARRRQSYVWRAVFVGGLLLALWTQWEVPLRSPVAARVGPTIRDLAALGQQLYIGMALAQISLVMLAAPAATAGAVCLDRARGSLDHMLVTDLSDGEIVLGKLAARLLPVAALVASGVPVLALSMLLGGVMPEALVWLTLVTAGVAAVGCTLALAFSVRTTRPHEVLMAVYGLEVLWLFGVYLWLLVVYLLNGSVPNAPPSWLVTSNPLFLAVAVYGIPGIRADATDVAWFLAATFGLSALLAAFAVWRLRAPVRPRRRRADRWEARFAALHATLFSWWPTPDLDGNPVLWREWYRTRPSRTTRVVRVLFLATLAVGMACAIRDALAGGNDHVEFFALTGVLGVGFGLLMLSTSAPTVLSEERARGSLDLLLSTPLSTREIVLGKWWAVFRRWLPLALLPALSGFFLAALADDVVVPSIARVRGDVVAITYVDRIAVVVIPTGFVLAHAAAATSFGLLAATWVARPGRAAAASVVAYLVTAIGGIWLVPLWGQAPAEWVASMFCYDPTQSRRAADAVTRVLMCVSPLGSQITPFETCEMWYLGRYRRAMWVGESLTLLAVAAVAAGLLGLTLLTFDRRMGRVRTR